MGGTARIVTLVLLSPSAGAVVQQEQLCAETLGAGHWGPTPVDFGGLVPAWPQGLSTSSSQGHQGPPWSSVWPFVGKQVHKQTHSCPQDEWELVCLSLQSLWGWVTAAGWFQQCPSLG